jgi:hypothetical protein
VSVRVVGNWLGLQISKPDDKHVNANGEFIKCNSLKRNSAQMKTTELQKLWKLVKSGEKRPLSAADLALLLRIRFALQEYAATETKAVTAVDLTKRQ